ncbi:MAG: hypothetical protein M3O32_20035 [Actinomycetota bacterium]|nr:hypothetical protein [Actinomycetota bacterium]
MSAPAIKTSKKRMHPVDEVLPLPKLATYGFQHVVAFYAGAVLVPIIIAGAINLPQEELVKLITADLFTCGIASIIQAVGFRKVGVRLPLLQGRTFAGVSPIIAVGLAHEGGAASLLYAFEQRPFADTRALREALQDAVLTGSSEQQLQLINAFHDLGAEDETGHALAVDHVALSNLAEDDHNDVVELASAYREHFGFPLVSCARETEHFGRVIENGWSRMDNSTPAEKAFALIEIAKIANHRFDDLVADANPIAAARFSRLNELQ